MLCDKIDVKDGWVTCPACPAGRKNHRLIRITDETEAANLPVYCRKCKKTTVLNIRRGQLVERRSP